MINRRTSLLLFASMIASAKMAHAKTPKLIMWDDLIPPGVPYAEIIAEGEIDEANDFWNPVYDENAIKLNDALDGAYIRMPGFIIPFDIGAEGVRDFMLVPYVGACIHTPPPPANQIIYVTTSPGLAADRIYEAWEVEGVLRTAAVDSAMAQAAYQIEADSVALYGGGR